MAIVSINLVRSEGGTANADGSSTAALRYVAITDSLEDDHFLIADSPDIPRPGAMYNFYGRTRPGLHLKGYKVQLKSSEESRFIWDVIGEYSTDSQPSDNKQGEQTGDPLDMTPKISIYCVKERKAILRDLTGRAIRSSAGEPYDPVQERDVTRTMVRIIRNVLRCNPEVNQIYGDALNLTPWGGFPAQKVKCETPGAVEVLYTGEGERYYQETWEFSLPLWNDEDAEWETRQMKLYDYGMYKVSGGERENLKDKNNRELVSAAFLNGAGAVLSPSDDPVFLPEFKIYPVVEFKNIGLPETI